MNELVSFLEDKVLEDEARGPERVGLVRGWPEADPSDAGVVTFPNWNRDHVHGDDWEDLFAVDTEWERRVAMDAWLSSPTMSARVTGERDTIPKKVTRQRARAAERGLGHDLTNDDWSGILEAYRWACVYCGATKRIVMDHFHPVCLGGGTTRDNVVPACWRCNSEKSRMTPERYFASYPLRCAHFRAAQEAARDSLEKKKAG